MRMHALIALTAWGLAASVDAEVGRWTAREQTDPMTDQRRGIASVESDAASQFDRSRLPASVLMNTAPANIDGSTRHTLVVKCDYERQDVYVAFLFAGGFNRSSSTLAYRFDQGEVTTVPWTSSRDGAAHIFAPSEVERFVIGARSASRIAFRITPPEGGPVETTTFSGAGSSAAIARVYAACGQQLPI